MDPENTRYKGFLRIMGCGAGLVLALIMLTLDIQSISFLLLVVFLGTALFAYVHYGRSEVNYFGTQAVIVFFIGVVASLGPTIHMDIAIERLVAIILGVSSIVLFQHVFWRFRGVARCRHHIRQFKCAMQPIMTAVIQHHAQAYTVWPNVQPYFFSMRLALRSLRDTDSDTFALLRTLFYQTYFLVELMQHSTYPQLLITLYPDMEPAMTQLCHDLVKPYFSSKEKQQAYENMVQLEAYFADARQQIRQKKMLSDTQIGQAFEVITALSTLRHIVQAQKQLFS